MKKRKHIFLFQTLAIMTLALPLFTSCKFKDSQNNDNVQNSDDGIIPSGLYKNKSIIVDGTERSYGFYIPANLNKSLKYPLVFLMHGNGSTMDDIMGFTEKPAPFKVWLDIADENQLIVVFPQGLAGGSGKNGWNDCRGDAISNPTSDDVKFIENLINDFVDNYSVDSRRIFASGISNGGHMSIRLALELPDKIAAIAAVAASMPADSKCTSATAGISVAFINGTADPIMPYTGGTIGKSTDGRGTVLSTFDSVNLWRNTNLTTSTQVTNLPDLKNSDSSTIKKELHSGGLQGSEVLLYEVVGGGHIEPSKVELYSNVFQWIVGKQNRDIEMAAEVWSFFSNKSK